MSNPNGPDNVAEAVNGEHKKSPENHNSSKPAENEQTPNEKHEAGESEENGNVNGDTSKKPKDDNNSKDAKSKKGPAGGFDSTPIPKAPPGWTIKVTIHHAENLPPADINTLSSDPYVITQLYSNNQTRHNEDPPLQWRTFTVRKNMNPEWNEEWIVANVPSHGFKLKCRLYDEDPQDHDDRLGNVHINVPHIDENWKGIQKESFKLKKRMGSKRAYFIQALSLPLRKRHEMAGYLTVSIELLGRTESQHGGRVYTVGPMRWMKHYSPLLGRLVNKKTPKDDDAEEAEKPSAEKYNFQANQFQLCGPVPAELYHRFVEFRPFVKGMFTGAGIQGFFLHKALSHQHSQIYRFDKATEFGYLGEKPSLETTMKFLDLCHFDEGGRIFTYIITLDALWRFTETGKEFGIDMLSKHTMHSDVSIYIAISGEFFIRRRQMLPESSGQNESLGTKATELTTRPSTGNLDPSQFELVIDNDSGTYRPNADLLPKFKEFLSFNLPGLQIMTLDCQKDGELEQELKKKQREKKKDEMGQFVFKQTNRSGSISSSDESDLEDLATSGHQDSNFTKAIKNDLSLRGKNKAQRVKKFAKGPAKEALRGEPVTEAQANGA